MRPTLFSFSFSFSPPLPVFRSAQNSRDVEDKTLRVTAEPFYTAATKKGGSLFQDIQFQREQEEIVRTQTMQQQPET